MLKFFTLMLMTFILVSCGGGKSTATLSISRGMVLANTAFSGGIYITGEKTDGSQSFQTVITSGNTANVSIGFGNWNLKIIGWHGAGLMAGTAYCKYVANYPFTSEGQNLEVTTSAPDCFTTNISGTSQHVTANTGPWKTLVVNSCGATYNPSTTNITITNGYFDPCSTDYPVEYQKTYSYYKVLLVNQDINGNRTAGISSACLMAKSSATVLFPNRMPVTLKFFKDSSCSTEVDEYVFKKGLDFALSQGRSVDAFDWGVTADTAKYFVTVANGASKRGTSAFHSETPIFKCLDGANFVPCTKFPTTVAGTYYLDMDTYAVVKLPQQTCGSLTSTVSIVTFSCDVINGDAYVGLKSTLTAPTSGTMSMNGVSYTVYVGNSYDSNDRVRDAYKTLKRTLGYRNTSNLNNSLADDFDEEGNDQMGLLDSAIFELSPMGAGGTFYDYYNQCSPSALAQLSRSYVKNGITYTVSLSGISGVAPGFTARSDEPDFMGTENRYNRRIVVRKFLGPSYTTEKIIDLECDNDTTNNTNYVSGAAQVRNGRMEEQRTYALNAFNVNLKKVIFWNTSSSDTARFDVYRTKRIASSSNTTQKIERNYYRVAKSSTDAANHFKIHAMNYLTVRDGSAFDESISVSEVDGKDISGTLKYSHKRTMDYSTEDGTVGGIFQYYEPYAAELFKVRFGYHQPADEQEQSKVSSAAGNFVQARKDPASGKLQLNYTDSGVVQSQTLTYVPDNIATDISPDGTKMIVAANYMNTIHYYLIISGIVTPSTITTSLDPTDIKVGIQNNGDWIVGYIDTDIVNWKTNSSTTSSPYSSYVHKGLSILKDGAEFYLNFTRKGTDQYAEICKGSNGACTGYANRTATPEYTYSSAYLSGSTIYATYVQNGILNLNTITASTLAVGTETQPTQVRKFSPYLNTRYTPLDSSVILRAAAGTLVETDFSYYNPTLPAFEMMPVYLQQSIFDTYFSSAFTTQTN